MDQDKQIEDKLQLLADLLADHIWNEYQNGVLKFPENKSNVDTDKVDPLETESFNYGSR